MALECLGRGDGCLSRNLMFLQMHRKKVDRGKLVVLIWNNKSNVSCSRKFPTLLRFVNLLLLRKKKGLSLAGRLLRCCVFLLLPKLLPSLKPNDQKIDNSAVKFEPGLWEDNYRRQGERQGSRTTRTPPRTRALKLTF